MVGEVGNRRSQTRGSVTVSGNLEVEFEKVLVAQLQRTEILVRSVENYEGAIYWLLSTWTWG